MVRATALIIQLLMTRPLMHVKYYSSVSPNDVNQWREHSLGHSESQVIFLSTLILAEVTWKAADLDW